MKIYPNAPAYLRPVNLAGICPRCVLPYFDCRCAALNQEAV